MTTLLVELIERVVDYAAEDSSTLKTCALTNSAFLPRCRAHRFQTVFLQHPSTYFHFLELIQTSPHVSRLTTRLVLGDLHGGKNDDRPLPILQILDKLSNICTLSVQPTFTLLACCSLPPATREDLSSAFSRPSITSVWLNSWLSVLGQSDHDEVQSLVRHCAGTKLRHLKIYALMRDFTRASASHGRVHLEALSLRDPKTDPSCLVPVHLPLLDLSHLTFLCLEMSTSTPSLEWMRGIAEYCPHTLKTLVWRPTHADLRAEAELYPLSQFPVLQHLCINAENRCYPLEPITSFLRRFLDSLSSMQDLKSLTVQCKRADWRRASDEEFVQHMLGFLKDLNSVERTVISISISSLAEHEVSLQSTLEKFRTSGLEGEHPGTSCVLEFDLK